MRKEIFSQIMKRKVSGVDSVWEERHAYGMKCQWCEKEFTPLKSWQKYCSPACRVAANWKRLPKDEVHTQETVLSRLRKILYSLRLAGGRMFYNFIDVIHKKNTNIF